MARFFADEDFDAEIGQALAQLGHDLDGVVPRGLGNRGTCDDAVLALAAGEGRIFSPTIAGISSDSTGLPRTTPASSFARSAVSRRKMAATIDRLQRERGSLGGRLVRVNLGDHTVE